MHKKYGIGRIILKMKNNQRADAVDQLISDSRFSS
jgi:hypothetical protein